jgi:hypothetical protein
MQGLISDGSCKGVKWRDIGRFRRAVSLRPSMTLFEPLFVALNAAAARYVVVGGFATVLHGFARLTADIDLIVDLEPAAARATIETLVGLGMRPRAPVDPLTFSVEEVRRRWIAEKGMRVFSMWDPKSPMREVDLFVESPLPFEELWERSELVSLGTVPIRIAGIRDLVALKRLAGRPQDLRDIDALEAIERKKKR